MNLFDYIVEEYGVPEEDKKDLQKELKKYKVSPIGKMYEKDPPYIMEPYMTQIKRMNDRYKTMGGKVG